MRKMSDIVSGMENRTRKCRQSTSILGGPMHEHVASLLARATTIVPAVVAQWQLLTTHSR